MADNPRRSPTAARSGRKRKPEDSDPRLLRHFDAAYRELTRLRDGSTVLLRAVDRTDKDLLRRGFARLSPRSRYLRFLSPKSQLSEAELEDLVSLDGVDRFALGARAILPDGREGEGLAVARFARLANRPAAAEAAVTVIDAAQGKGLGTLLLLRLAAAARERGIDRFVCEFHTSNEHIQRLVARLAPGAEAAAHGFVRAEVLLPAVSPDDPPGAIDRESLAYGLLAGSARAQVAVRLTRPHPGVARRRRTASATRRKPGKPVSKYERSARPRRRTRR
jgi:GNAT superfamily N-acetyltransferase